MKDLITVSRHHTRTANLPAHRNRPVIMQKRVPVNPEHRQRAAAIPAAHARTLRQNRGLTLQNLPIPQLHRRHAIRNVLRVRAENISRKIMLKKDRHIAVPFFVSV